MVCGGGLPLTGNPDGNFGSLEINSFCFQCLSAPSFLHWGRVHCFCSLVPSLRLKKTLEHMLYKQVGPIAHIMFKPF